MGVRVYVIQVFDCVFGGQGYNRNLTYGPSRDFGFSFGRFWGEDKLIDL